MTNQYSPLPKHGRNIAMLAAATSGTCYLLTFNYEATRAFLHKPGQETDWVLDGFFAAHSGDALKTARTLLGIRVDVPAGAFTEDELNFPEYLEAGE